MTSSEPSRPEGSPWGCWFALVLMLAAFVWLVVYVSELLQPTETRSVTDTVLSPSGRLKAEVLDVWWSGMLLTVVTSEVRISKVDHPEVGGLALGYSGSRDLPEWLDDHTLLIPLPNHAAVGERALKVLGVDVRLQFKPDIPLTRRLKLERQNVPKEMWWRFDVPP